MKTAGTVVAIEREGEAKSVRDLESGWTDPETKCQIETDDGEVIWASVVTFRLARPDEWFRRERIRVYQDEHSVWNPCKDWN